MTKQQRLSLCAIALAAITATSAHADAITLFNTGVDSQGQLLADSTLGDPHYSLADLPGGSSTLRVITSATGFPVGPWIGDNTSSRWIGPNNDTMLDGPAGAYTYRTTFDLTGFDATSAMIEGGWATDNSGLDIRINGNSLGYTTASNQFQLGLAAFSINSGFVAGINTLDFIVYNSEGPTGLRVEMAGTADLSQAVPEPSALALVGLALTGLALSRRRTR
jgi:hypothetical protein